MKKILIAATLLVLLAAETADAWPGKRFRHRDDKSIRTKNGAWNQGWHWTQRADGVNYCYRILQRQQDRARKNLDKSMWLVQYLANGMEIDWLRDGRADALQGENPCLLPGVKAGPQTKAPPLDPVLRVSVEGIGAPANCSPVDCVPDVGLALDLGFLCGGLVILERNIAKKGADHHPVSPLVAWCAERLDP